MRRLGVKLGGGARLKPPIQNAHVPKSRVSELGGVKALRHLPHLPYPLLTCPPFPRIWHSDGVSGASGASGASGERVGSVTGVYFPPAVAMPKTVRAKCQDAEIGGMNGFSFCLVRYSCDRCAVSARMTGRRELQIVSENCN